MDGMKAIKKANPINVVEVTSLPAVQGGLDNVRIRARAGEFGHRFEVWNALHQSWIGVNVGDYLNVTDAGDVYPIDADYFAQNYEVVK
jgi:hypothetical protein